MLGNMIGGIKGLFDDTEQIDDQFYAEVADELDRGYKDKAAYAKSIAQSEGDEAKATSLYIKIRAEALQEEYRQRNEVARIGRKKQQQNRQQLASDIAKRYQDGYFHNLFKDEIMQKGFTSTWYAKHILKKDGMEYRTGIDFDNMDFFIKDKKNKIIHRFHFEEQ